MPPKAARGAGRGRGRGQGKAPAPPAAEQPSTSQLNTQNDIDSQSKMAASPPPEPLAPRITTPQNELLEYADPSPNSSPATVWTETPAPTPIRPPSTLRTGSSSSVLSATRGGIASRGSRVKTTESRFKPKNIRRDARELEELRKKERIRLDAIAAEETSREAWKARAGMGRGWGMRGRGDAMGRGAGRGRSAATASGIFGVVPEGLREWPSTAYADRMLIIKTRQETGIPSPEGFNCWRVVTKWWLWAQRTKDSQDGGCYSFTWRLYKLREDKNQRFSPRSAISRRRP
jgi:DNA-directed RNA polymerase III subunit RPC4